MIELVKIVFPINLIKTTYFDSLCAKINSAHKPHTLYAKPTISITLNIQHTRGTVHFSLGSPEETEIIRNKILGAKDELTEKKKETIQVTTVIIQEGKKETADEILKKRLARGEITKEEFHDKIQRT